MLGRRHIEPALTHRPIIMILVLLLTHVEGHFGFVMVRVGVVEFLIFDVAIVEGGLSSVVGIVDIGQDGFLFQR